MAINESPSGISRSWRVRARTPQGREVEVVAVRRGPPLRELMDGSGSLVGSLIEIGLKGGAKLFSHLRRGWTVGVVSVDEEPWAGQRVLHREHCDSKAGDRVAALKQGVESGDLTIPQPRNILFRRNP